MYNASPELITAIKQPYRIVSCKVNFGTYINLTDEEIISIDITSNLCPSDEFEIGIAPMSIATIEIKWSEDVDYNYENQKADILFGLELPDATVEYVPMGKYTVEKATVSKRNLTLELVDNMHKAERDFTGTITFPSTVKTIVNSACSQSGLTLATSSFANSNMVITEEMSFFNTTCRQVLAQAAELAGGWAVINRSGQLEIITLGGTSLRQITSNQYFEFNVDEVANSHINKVVVNVGEESASAGTGADIYHVVNNIFVQDPTLPVTALYNVLNGTYYIAGSLSWQGDFTLDLGDRVTVEGEPFYIMNRNLSYSGGISERTESPAVSNILKDTTVRGSLSLALAETLTEFKIMDGKIEATVSKANEAYTTANGAASTASSAYSKATQTASQIQTVVNRVDTIDGDIVTMNSSISQNATNITLKVSKNGVISSINQTPESATISASKINLSGYVTVSSLGQYGSTTIHGSRIETGTLTATGVDISGKITATSGKIGELEITSSLLQYRPDPSSQVNRTYFSGKSSDTYVFASYDSSGTRTFSIARTGGLYATSATISGKVTADSYSTLGGSLNSTSGTHSGALYRTSGAHWGTHTGAAYNSSGTLGGSSYSSGSSGVLFTEGVYVGAEFNCQWGKVTGSTSHYDWSVTGNMYCSGTLTQASDRALKEHIEPVNQAVVQELYSLDIRQFDFTNRKDSDLKSVGVIAQDVIAKSPTLASYTIVPDGKGYLAADYIALGTLSVLAIQDLDKRLKKLEQEAA